jgi:hypothetical protein
LTVVVSTGTTGVGGAGGALVVAADAVVVVGAMVVGAVSRTAAPRPALSARGALLESPVRPVRRAFIPGKRSGGAMMTIAVNSRARKNRLSM